jgi:hypothetical protein
VDEAMREDPRAPGGSRDDSAWIILDDRGGTPADNGRSPDWDALAEGAAWNGMAAGPPGGLRESAAGNGVAAEPPGGLRESPADAHEAPPPVVIGSASGRGDLKRAGRPSVLPTAVTACVIFLSFLLVLSSTTGRTP